ncbi:MAG TPA: rhodanese-like domain-containing protein [Gemmatimonadaceae bacterium]|nr:rhodanese-like domain-containing protein [Gemmatimonadaceae bacterium]
MEYTSTISRDELREKIDRADPFFLFEVLPEPYFRKHHLPGAIHLPPNDIPATVQRIVADKSAEIVVYCWDEH